VPSGADARGREALPAVAFFAERPLSPPLCRGATSPRGAADAPPFAERPPPPPSRSGCRRVRFDVGLNTEHEVTPYAEVYGLHPGSFVFDRHGRFEILSANLTPAEERRCLT